MKVHYMSIKTVLHVKCENTFQVNRLQWLNQEINLYNVECSHSFDTQQMYLENFTILQG